MLNPKFESCSKEVQRGIKWLDGQIRKEGWHSSNAVEFYALMKVDSPLVKEFLSAAKSDVFWDKGALWDDSYLLWYLARMGLSSNEYFKKAVDYTIKDNQTVRGHIHSNYYTHTGPLRVLVFLEPNSKPTNMAIEYFLENLEDYKDDYQNLALGILALSELDHLKYKNLLEQLCTGLQKSQNLEGYWAEGWENNEKNGWKIKAASLILPAISRIFGTPDLSVKRCVDWLKKIQKTNGSWENHPGSTADAILTLISAGDGAKISLEDYENQKIISQHKIQRARSHFVHTSPPSSQIKDKIKEMLNNATTRVLICSRFITEFWVDIIKLKNDNPALDLRVITIPRNVAKNGYKGAGKKFVEPAFDGLQRTLQGNFRTNDLLHSRLYIIDAEVLVSSADITTEQLEKEYNAGVWTKDEETLEMAANFFEKIWEDSEK